MLLLKYLHRRVVRFSFYYINILNEIKWIIDGNIMRVLILISFINKTWICRFSNEDIINNMFWTHNWHCNIDLLSLEPLQYLRWKQCILDIFWNIHCDELYICGLQIINYISVVCKNIHHLSFFSSFKKNQLMWKRSVVVFQDKNAPIVGHIGRNVLTMCCFECLL